MARYKPIAQTDAMSTSHEFHEQVRLTIDCLDEVSSNNVWMGLKIQPEAGFRAKLLHTSILLGVF
jgi:hypothetical protein